jgi:hypothetical protein
MYSRITDGPNSTTATVAVREVPSTIIAAWSIKCSCSTDHIRMAMTLLYYVYDYYSILLSLYFVAAVAAPSNLSKAPKTYYTTLQSFSEHF